MTSHDARLSGRARLLLVAFVVLGALARLPALGVPFLGDDLQMLDALEHVTPPAIPSRGWFDLYHLASGDPAEAAERKRTGTIYWWSDPRTKLAFLRPLSSASLALDHALVGRDARLAHALSFAWYFAALAAVWQLVRRVLPSSEAVMAFGVFALGFNTTLGVGWWCNRHSLVVVALAVTALVAHLAWRDGGRPLVRMLAAGLFLLSLGAGEAALAVVPYLLAYELLRRDASRSERALAVAPYLAIASVYLLAYAAFGYGTARSGYYASPLESPVAFLANLRFLPNRLGFLVTGALPIGRGGAVVGLASLPFVAAFAWLARRSAIGGAAANAPWLALGAAGAIAPTLSGNDDQASSLLMAFVGVSCLAGTILVHGTRALRKRIAEPARGRVATGAVVFGVLLLVLPVPGTAFTLASMADDARSRASAARELAASPGVRDVVVLHGDQIVLPSDTGAARSGFSSVTTVSSGATGLTIERTAANTVLLRSETPLTPRFDAFRRADTTFREGDAIDVPVGRVVVVKTSGADVLSIELRLDRPADDPALGLFVMADGHATRLRVGAVGERVALPNG